VALLQNRRNQKNKVSHLQLQVSGLDRILFELDGYILKNWNRLVWSVCVHVLSQWSSSSEVYSICWRWKQSYRSVENVVHIHVSSRTRLFGVSVLHMAGKETKANWGSVLTSWLQSVGCLICVTQAESRDSNSVVLLLFWYLLWALSLCLSSVCL
jgi:hypothetical protein